MPKYYHLSKRAGLEVLQPYVTPKNRRMSQEPAIKRCCVSRSILGCLRATQASEEEFFVYCVNPSGTGGIIPNKYVKEFVPDAGITGEVWLLRETPCLCLGKIRGNGAWAYGRRLKYEWVQDFRSCLNGRS